MQSLYKPDLAYIHAAAFSSLAAGAAPEIIRRLKSAGISIRRVLEVGCGSGVLAAALADAGFNVVGVDSSVALLEMARVNAPKAHFIQGSAYDVAIVDFDAVVAVGEPLTYHFHPDQADPCIRRFFESVAKGIPPGGMLIFDVIGLGQPSLAGRNWTSGEDWAVLVEVTEDQSQRRLVREIETFRRMGENYRRSREVHQVRLFDVAGLCDQLATVGFAVETADSYGTQPLAHRRTAFFATRSAIRSQSG